MTSVPRFGRRVLSYLASTACILVLSIALEASARSFRCFFALQSAELTTRCRLIIAEDVETWRAVRDGRLTDFQRERGLTAHMMRVEIHAYAQDSDSPDFDERLSQARGAAIAEEMGRLGIPRELIAVLHWGARRPLAPGQTLDPQNRRAEWVFR
jgi:hypothetical protein